MTGLLHNETVITKCDNFITKCVSAQRNKSWNNLTLWICKNMCLSFSFNFETLKLFSIEKFANRCEEEKFLVGFRDLQNQQINLFNPIINEEFDGMIPFPPLDSKQTLLFLRGSSKMSYMSMNGRLVQPLRLTIILLHFVRRLM